MTLLQRLSITVVFITMAATDSALYSARVLLSRLRLAHAHADLRAGHLYQKEKTRLEALIDEHIDRYSGLKQDRALLEYPQCWAGDLTADGGRPAQPYL
jgi:hypothetical protein